MRNQLMSLLITMAIISLIIVVIALPFCRGLKLGKKALVNTQRKEKILTGSLENTLENRVAKEVTQELVKINKYRGENKANFSKILSGDIDKVSQLYNELQICQGIGNQFLPDAVIDKMLNIAVGDHGTNDSEVLFIFEYLHDRILPKHIRYLKQLFIRYGSSNNVFDVELYKVVLSCTSCQEKNDFLDLIQSVSLFTPDLISLKLKYEKTSSPNTSGFAKAE